MTTRRTTVRQADIVRAIRAVTSAGLTVVRVEVEGGKVVVYTGEAPVPEECPLEAWRRSRQGEEAEG